MIATMEPDRIIGYLVLTNNTVICPDCSYLWADQSELDAIYDKNNAYDIDGADRCDICNKELK